ncbi:MAG: T9SS C-terminal target domain-containing protein, partial [Chitinophagaceae bacterium]
MIDFTKIKIGLVVVCFNILLLNSLKAQTEWNYRDDNWLMIHWSMLKFNDSTENPKAVFLKDSIFPLQYNDSEFSLFGHYQSSLNHKETGDLQLALIGNFVHFQRHLVDHKFHFLEQDTFINWLGYAQVPFFMEIKEDTYMLITTGYNPDFWYYFLNPEVKNPYTCFNNGVSFYNYPFWYYHIFERTANGHFNIVEKNNLFLKDKRMGARLSAARHANGKDWWLLMQTVHCNNQPGGEIYRFLVKDGEISAPHIIPADNELYGFRDDVGRIIFSHDAEKVIFTSMHGQVDVYDFNRCNGDITFLSSLGYNPTSTFLNSPSDDSLKIHGIYGASLSPNNRFLYVNNTALLNSDLFNPFCDSLFIYRFDLHDLGKREVLIQMKACDTLAFGHMNTAPNRKIYMSHLRYEQKMLQPDNPYWDSSMAYMPAIVNPDEEDINDVIFDLEHLYLGDSAKMSGSLPYFVNHLGALPVYQTGAIQDTLQACYGDTIQLGKDPIDNITYEWQELNIQEGRHEANPEITAIHSGLYTVRLEEVGVERFSCTERIDSVFVKVENCYIPEEKDPMILPTIVEASGTYTILNLREKLRFEVFNLLGQRIFQENNYSNNWQLSGISRGMYLYRLHLEDGEVQ